MNSTVFLTLTGSETVSSVVRIKKDEMKFTFNAVVLALCFMVVLAGLLFFGFRWSMANLYNEEIMRVKPWQPIARAALTVVLFTLTCVFGGAIIRVTARDL